MLDEFGVSLSSSEKFTVKLLRARRISSQRVFIRYLCVAKSVLDGQFGLGTRTSHSTVLAFYEWDQSKELEGFCSLVENWTIPHIPGQKSFISPLGTRTTEIFKILFSVVCDIYCLLRSLSLHSVWLSRKVQCVKTFSLCSLKQCWKRTTGAFNCRGKMIAFKLQSIFQTTSLFRAVLTSLYRLRVLGSRHWLVRIVNWTDQIFH